MSKNPLYAAVTRLRLFRLGSNYAGDRHYLLAYGLLRGFPMSRLESPNSDPYSFGALDFRLIGGIVASYRGPDPEGTSPQEQDAIRATIQNRVVDELRAWQKQLYLNWAELDIQKRARNVAKRTTPRIHPRPMKVA